MTNGRQLTAEASKEERNASAIAAGLEQIEEETLRKRIAHGYNDVVCVICERRHNFDEGAAESCRQKSTEQAVRMLQRPVLSPNSRSIRLLHLSDLHFEADTSIQARLQPLVADIRDGLGFEELDYLVVSGDFTSKGRTAERCVCVPGNHDTVDVPDAYTRRMSSHRLPAGEWVQEGRVFLARDPEKYPLRFKSFSDGFFHKFLLERLR